jgi:quercetin dioxygenase-like cupin family protein
MLFARLAAVSVLAQDPIKVEPTHYKLDFENAHVQVVHINYGPHEKSKLHSHPAGVVVNITGAHLRFTDENGKVQEVYSKVGEARWFPPFQHRVENLSDRTSEGVYVAVKNEATAH